LDENKNVIAFYDGGNENIDPFHPHGYQNYTPHANPNLVSIPFPATTSDSVTVFAQHIFREQSNGDGNPKNDTAVYRQNFYNYYAYDDGTPESGYVITSSANPYKKSLALEFTLNKPDTLRAIDIYLNHTMNDATFFNFTLSVWSAVGGTKGMPGQELYAKEVSQEYSSELYGFQRFHLTEPLPVAGKFFIGYQIAGQNRLFNVGFDQNTDASSHTFWRTNGSWDSSFMVGSPMLRPVLGREIPNLSIVENPASFDMKLYPNPAKETLYIAIPDEMKTRNITMSIYSVAGQKIYEQPYRSEVSLSAFAPGLYIVHLTDNEYNIKSVRKFSLVK
jgi:hypothetical protein